MIRSLFITVLMAGSLSAAELAPEQVDTLKPFAECVPASIHARQLLDEVAGYVEYQGDEVQLCREMTLPAVVAWSRLVSLEPHPYIGWKKLAVTQAYLSYNPLFMEQLEVVNPHLPYAVMAQQLGHHIKGHPNYETPVAGLEFSPEQQAEVDYYVGLVLAKRALTVEQFVEVRRAFYSLAEFPETTGLAQRNQQMMKGWVAGGGAAISTPDDESLLFSQRW